ncbi:hypothetical protein JK636_13850 [Clostridium sp. YIM B02515]|uniref:Uncharacterized protein n=1 Tax=Clostridium rhizosphaerae TaxID=2803861 RepID=A0ABS1TBW8_9CLOT|nr:hypothetical protein [Clostridium rhizosphaerae]MBL4936840.1 hypothetical protein [Clostridium rhizosphaerae]
MKILFMVCKAITILISCFVLFNLIKLLKKHKNLSDEKYLSKENRLIRKKYLVMGIVGITICLLMEIFIIFTK